MWIEGCFRALKCCCREDTRPEHLHALLDKREREREIHPQVAHRCICPMAVFACIFPPCGPKAVLSLVKSSCECELVDTCKCWGCSPGVLQDWHTRAASPVLSVVTATCAYPQEHMLLCHIALPHNTSEGLSGCELGLQQHPRLVLVVSCQAASPRGAHVA